MTTLETLRGLKARLEAATGPDRELEHTLCIVAFGEPSGLLMDYQTYLWKTKVGVLTSKELRVTSSLDAALTFKEAVLPKSHWSIMSNGPDYTASVEDIENYRVAVTHDAPTAPLAICLAVVSAKITELESS